MKTYTIYILLMFPALLFSNILKSNQIPISINIENSNDEVRTEHFKMVESTILSTFGKNNRFVFTSEEDYSFEIYYSISSVVITKQQFKTTEGKILPYFVCDFVGNVEIKKLETQAVVHSEVLQFQAGKGFIYYNTYARTANMAFKNMLRIIEKKTKNLIREHFPVEAKLVRVLEENKKKEPLKCLINKGKSSGIVKGQFFQLYEVIIEEFEGKTMNRRNHIGTIKVVEVSDDNFSECKITKGKNKLKQALQNGQTIEMVSKKKAIKF